MVEEVLVDVLQRAGLTVYPMRVPTDASFPCVVYQRISTDDIKSHDGEIVLSSPRFQLTCWDENYLTVIETAEAVKSVMDFNQVDFKLSYRDGEIDMLEEEVNLYRRVLDYIIWT